MEIDYLPLPDEVECELNYEVQDSSLRLEHVVQCLQSIGWENISPNPYVFSNVVNYFDTDKHEVFKRGESLRLRSRIEEINGLVRATHKKSILCDGFYAKRLLTRASFERSSDLIKGVSSFALDRKILTEKPSHKMVEYLKNKNVKIERDGFIFYVTSQSKNFTMPKSDDTKYAKTYEIEISKESKKASEEELHLMLEEMHRAIEAKGFPLLVSKDNSYCRGYKLVYGKEGFSK